MTNDHPLRMDAKWRIELDPTGRGPELFTKREAANALRVAESTLKNMERRGEMPTPVTIAGRAMYRRQDIMRMIGDEQDKSPSRAILDNAKW